MNGVKMICPGDLAIQCLSCLHPDINLPDGWEKAPQDQLLPQKSACVFMDTRPGLEQWSGLFCSLKELRELYSEAHR